MVLSRLVEGANCRRDLLNGLLKWGTGSRHDSKNPHTVADPVVPVLFFNRQLNSVLRNRRKWPINGQLHDPFVDLADLLLESRIILGTKIGGELFRGQPLRQALD